MSSEARFTPAIKSLPTKNVDRLMTIVKAFVVASTNFDSGPKSVGFMEAVPIAGLDPLTVRSQVKFLIESGILDAAESGKCIPAEPTILFARESIGNTERAKVHLRAASARSWWVQAAARVLANGRILTVGDMQQALMSASGNSDAVGIGYVIDLLVYAGFAEDVGDGRLRATPEMPAVESSVLAAPAGAAVSVVVNVTLGLDELTEENAQRIREWVARVQR